MSQDIINCKQYGAEYFQGTLENIFKTVFSTALLYTINQIHEVIVHENPIYENLLQCNYCNKQCLKKSHLQQHEEACKEKKDIVRYLEMQLNIPYPTDILHTQCRFCQTCYTQKNTLTQHIKKCKKKQEYKEKLETQVAKLF